MESRAHLTKMNKNRDRRNEISNTSPLRERNNAVDSLSMAIAKTVSVTRSSNALTMTTKVPDTNTKENGYLSFEISIPDGADLQLQVEVVDERGNVVSRSPLSSVPTKPIILSNNGAYSNRIGKPMLRTSPSPVKKNEMNKQLTWHESVIDAVKSHKLNQRDKSTAKITTNQLKSHNETIKQTTTDEPTTRNHVTERKAIFERNSPTQEFVRDPSRLSVRERFRIFEQKKGPAIIPLAAFGMAPSAKQIANRSLHSATLSESMFATTNQQNTSILRSQSFCIDPNHNSSAPVMSNRNEHKLSDDSIVSEDASPNENQIATNDAKPIVNYPEEDEFPPPFSIVNDPKEQVPATDEFNNSNNSQRSNGLNVSQGVGNYLLNSF